MSVVYVFALLVARLDFTFAVCVVGGGVPVCGCIALAFDPDDVNPKQPVQRLQCYTRHFGVFVLKERAQNNSGNIQSIFKQQKPISCTYYIGSQQGSVVQKGSPADFQGGLKMTNILK